MKVTRKLGSRPRVIELFAGAGLWSGAFKAEGFEVVAAYEIDPVAAQSYEKNAGRHMHVGDVRSKSPEMECDVLLAGSPCQGFSTLGRRDPSDPRNQLSLEVIRWARRCAPKVIAIENVGAFLESQVHVRLVAGLERLGYHVASHIISALDFGVPQKRIRSFTVATRRGPVELVACGRGGISTVRDAWEGLNNEPDGTNLHVAPSPSPLALARMRLIPAGGDKRDILERAPHLAPPSWFRLGIEITDVWGRLNWDRPSNTLRTCLQNPSKGRYIHPEQHRTISLREAARLHSIPDAWTFIGWPTQIARQIGNSIPPRVGRAIARAVHRSL